MHVVSDEIYGWYIWRKHNMANIKETMQQTNRQTKNADTVQFHRVSRIWLSLSLLTITTFDAIHKIRPFLELKNWKLVVLWRNCPKDNINVLFYDSRSQWPRGLR
jgi:nicotinamide riboside transporter PnuC